MVTIITPGFSPHTVPYADGLEQQRRLHAAVVGRTRPSAVLLLEHDSVYTAGTRTRPEHRPTGPVPVLDVDRGGSITWHGPGQLIGYPIVRLPDPKNVVGFVRLLEQVIIEALAAHGVTGVLVSGRSGVWVSSGTPEDPRHNKIAAIGLRVSGGVSMHGFAVNCSNSLAPYDEIVACGIRDAGVTTISELLGHTVTPEEFSKTLRRALQTALDQLQQPARGTRKLLRVEARNSLTPIERKPDWIKTRARQGPEYQAIAELVRSKDLNTVCQQAGCPNIYECWEDREATFLIGGAECTRRCDFCQIGTGKPAEYDRAEPLRVAESVRSMGLRYATVTGVARDDLPDEGAWLHAETVRQIHELNPGTGVEILVTDLSGKPELLQQVFDARPEVFAHNVETVPRIFKRVRPAFSYERSLGVLTQARDAGMITKSNLILGMGESDEEVRQALRDLHEAGTHIITLTQYLRPTPRHLPVERWVRPEQFDALAEEAREIGFLGVLAGPLVRSSYRAGKLWAQVSKSPEFQEITAAEPAYAR